MSETRSIDELSVGSSRKRMNSSNSSDRHPSRHSIVQLQEDKRVQRLLEQIEGRNLPKKTRKPLHESPLNFHQKLRKHEPIKLNQRVKTPTRGPPNLVSGSRERSRNLMSSTPTSPRPPKVQSTLRPVTPIRLLNEMETPSEELPESTPSTPIPKSRLKVHPLPSDLAVCRPEDKDHSVKVVIRVRPLNSQEISMDQKTGFYLSDTMVNTISVPRPRGPPRTYSYDSIFWTSSRQQQIFDVVGKPMVDSLLEGYNVTIFGYGQTGSGKTYTMMGGKNEERGVIPRFYMELLERLEEMKREGVIEAAHCEVSYFEIYNERIYDLLNPPPKPVKRRGRPDFTVGKIFSAPAPAKTSLTVREAGGKGVYVAGLTRKLVSSPSDAEEYLRAGNEERATAATGMNEKSSRSHSLFQIYVKIKAKTDSGLQRSINCTASLIDLAGSERSDRAKTTGLRLKEGAAINKSLLTLGKVISTLAERKSGGKEWVPYRDSVLTHLLRDSLGGNSETAMIATVSAVESSLEETISTLNYAKTAKAIVNSAKINEELEAATIRGLQSEIDLLKKNHTYSREHVLAEKERYQEEINRLKLARESEKQEWEEKLASMAAIKSREKNTIDASPHLVNISADPHLTGFLVFLIPVGSVRVGKAEDCEIKINGNLIEEHHCQLERSPEGLVSLTAALGDTYVNGKLVEDSVALSGGDRLVFGSTHFFCFRNNTADGDQLDFDLAKNELLSEQKKAMEVEYRQMVEKNKAEMAEEIDQLNDQLDGDDDVDKGNESLLSMFQQMRERMCDVTDVPENHFEVVQLVKEANKVVGDERKMMFEVSGVGTVKATMGVQTSFIAADKLKEHLDQHHEDAEDDPEVSLTSIILAEAGTQWENQNGTSMNGTLGINRSHQQQRRRLSRKVSQLVMRSGLDASTLEIPEDVGDSSMGTVMAMLKLPDDTIASASDGLSHCLISLEDIYANIGDIISTNGILIGRKVIEIGVIIRMAFINIDSIINKVHKLNKCQQMLKSFVIRILDGDDEFIDHAKAKCLDMAKILGAIVKLGPYDHDRIFEQVKSQKIQKAMTQGAKTVTQQNIKPEIEEFTSSDSIDNVKCYPIEDAIIEDVIVEDVTVEDAIVEDAIVKYSDSVGKAGYQVDTSENPTVTQLTDSIEPLVDAFDRCKQADPNDPNELVTSYRAVKAACQSARTSCNTFNSWTTQSYNSLDSFARNEAATGENIQEAGRALDRIEEAAGDVITRWLDTSNCPPSV